MFGDGALTFQEFIMGEALPLAIIHRAVLEFLRGRDDTVLFGAQAVNAYVDEPRMTQDVDILSPRAHEVAEELRDVLHEQFHIAVRVRRLAEGLAYRVYQVQKPSNRHLADVRAVAQLPPSRRVQTVLVVAPEELIAGKVLAMTARRGRPKSGLDWRDIASLLLKFPDLKTAKGPVSDRLRAAKAPAAALAAWRAIVAQDILPEDEEAGY